MSWKPILVTLSTVGVFALAVLPSQPRPNVTLRRVPHGGIQPHLLVDGASVHLLYFSGDPKGGDLFYAKSPDYGVIWTVPLRVNSDPGTAIALGTIRGGEMAIGRNGRIHVAWNASAVAQSRGPVNPESGQRGAPMLYSRLNDNNTAFEPDRNLMTHTFGLDGGGTVASDGAGNVYVAWHGKAPDALAGEAGRQVWVAVSHDDGRTFGPEHPAWSESTGACGCCGMAMAAERNGTVRVLYRSATENVHRDIYLLTSLDLGRTFEGQKLHTWDINACPMSSMAFGESPAGTVGAWETGGQVYFKHLTKMNSAPVPAPGESTGRKHPRIAITPNGEMLMIWTDGTGWQRGGSLAWQLFGANDKAIGEPGMAPGIPTWSFGAVIAKPGGFLILY